MQPLSSDASGMWTSDNINAVAQCDSSPSERICVLLPRDRKGHRKGLGRGGFLPRNPPRNTPSWPGRGVPRGVLAQNGVSKNTPKLGITYPGPNVPQSRCIEGVVFVFKVFGCGRNV